MSLKSSTVKCFRFKRSLKLDKGGFFIIEPEFFSLIEGDQTRLEQEPLEKAAQMGELMAYRHEGFWQPMDTKRDKDYLEGLWEQGKGPLKS